MSKPEFTKAQRYVLNWIVEKGTYQPSGHPDALRQLGVPPLHRNAFNSRTLRILNVLKLIVNVGGSGLKAEYRPTNAGREALKEADKGNETLNTIRSYTRRLGDFAEHLPLTEQAALAVALKALYEETTGVLP